MEDCIRNPFFDSPHGDIGAGNGKAFSLSQNQMQRERKPFQEKGTESKKDTC